MELECGVTVYPARWLGDRWRAVWYENGERRYCQAVSEDRLAAKLEKITERLSADALHMEQPGADLITWYLSPHRPRRQPWSRKHADTQRRLCERFVTPVIGGLVCQDIRVADMRQIINAAPTAQQGERLRRCISAMVYVGIADGYLANPRLAMVYWQAGDRPTPLPALSVAGESGLFVDPAEIPAADDVAKLGLALGSTPARGQLYALMVYFAAYTGLRWGELAALSIGQIETVTRTVTVDRKVVEVGGKLFVEPPKGRKKRRTIYPRVTPDGYALAERVSARIEAARTEQDRGRNLHGLVFPSPRGRYWRSSNFARRVLKPAYQAADWRAVSGESRGDTRWTWHSLRHVFCTTALFTWHVDPTDVSRLAGHANVRTTLDMYVGATAGTLDRARTATE
jgi:integrase